MTALYQHSALKVRFGECFTRYSCTLMTLLCALVAPVPECLMKQVHGSSTLCLLQDSGHTL